MTESVQKTDMCVRQAHGLALGWLWVGLGSGLGSLGLALELVGLALDVLWRGCEPGLGLFWAGFGLALRLLGLALGWLWVGLGPGLTSFGLALACFLGHGFDKAGVFLQNFLRAHSCIQASFEFRVHSHERRCIVVVIKLNMH
jgi:hypothetical protein